jgi:glutaminyl-tRNA synthetase
VRWLGFEPDATLYASDYFERLYEIAEGLVRRGRRTSTRRPRSEIREGRGTVTEPGPTARTAPHARREPRPAAPDEAGEFPDGAHVLRARIDMAHPNMIMRDPLLLRIRHAEHYRRGARGASTRSTTSRTG